MTLKQALVFSILMQNGNGILDKAPSYIAEKLEICSMMPDPKSLLDLKNQAIYEVYMGMWVVKEMEEER